MILISYLVVMTSGSSILVLALAPRVPLSITGSRYVVVMLGYVLKTNDVECMEQRNIPIKVTKTEKREKSKKQIQSSRYILKCRLSGVSGTVNRLIHSIKIKVVLVHDLNLRDSTLIRL